MIDKKHCTFVSMRIDKRKITILPYFDASVYVACDLIPSARKVFDGIQSNA